MGWKTGLLMNISNNRGQIDIVYHVLVQIQCKTGTTIQHTIRFFMLDFAWCANALLLVLLLQLEPNSLRRYPILRGAPHTRSRTSRRVRGTSQFRPCNLETEAQNEFGMGSSIFISNCALALKVQLTLLPKFGISKPMASKYRVWTITFLSHPPLPRIVWHQFLVHLQLSLVHLNLQIPCLRPLLRRPIDPLFQS
jgi:hypothetical protein